MAYLDKTGLIRLWARIKSYVDGRVALSDETKQMFADEGYPIE